jgi:hypothetical protein
MMITIRKNMMRSSGLPSVSAHRPCFLSSHALLYSTTEEAEAKRFNHAQEGISHIRKLGGRGRANSRVERGRRDKKAQGAEEEPLLYRVEYAGWEFHIH